VWNRAAIFMAEAVQFFRARRTNSVAKEHEDSPADHGKGSTSFTYAMTGAYPALDRHSTNIEHRQASRGVNDPPDRRGATLRARRRGRSRHGLLTDGGRRGSDTGGRARRPIASGFRQLLPRTSTCAPHAEHSARAPTRFTKWSSGREGGQPGGPCGCPLPVPHPRGHETPTREVSCRY
jgi:hypothetical protein